SFIKNLPCPVRANRLSYHLDRFSGSRSTDPIVKHSHDKLSRNVSVTPTTISATHIGTFNRFIRGSVLASLVWMGMDLHPDRAKTIPCICANAEGWDDRRPS